VAALVAGLLAGCGQTLKDPVSDTASISPAGPVAGNPADEKSKAVKIALLLPTSGYGEPAQIARGMKQAAELALFEANNPAVQLIPKDDGGTPESAARAAEQAIGEGAEIILGPLLGKAVTGAAPVAAKAQVPMLAFSNDPSVAKPGVYLMSFLASEEVRRVVDYAATQGKRRYAALIPATGYGQTVESAFRTAIARNGAEIVTLETYTPDASSILASSKRVLQVIADAEKTGTPVDALFVPAGPDTVSELGSMLAYAGVDAQKVKLIGTSAWDMAAMSRDDKLLGGWYAASDPAAWTAFAEKYRKNFGTEPPRLASLAYDAMSIALSLAAVPAPGRYMAARLTRPEGFSGVDGAVKFLPGGLSERSLAVLEIQKYKSIVIDPARGGSEAERLSSLPAAVDR
jgi:ABC-type branched-subunit amino acid transport system substrate-binding protein